MITTTDDTYSSKNNIFGVPLSTQAPPSVFTRVEHPIKLPRYINTLGKAIETNKFYRNVLLGQKNGIVNTEPYSIRCNNNKNNIGVYVQSKFNPGNQIRKPVYLEDSILFSALQFDDPSKLYILSTSLKQFSVQVHLKISASEFMWLPLVQGMGFVTLIYFNLKPILYSPNIGFKEFNYLPTPRYGIRKYSIILKDDSAWILYVYVNENLMFDLFFDRKREVIIGNCLSRGCVFQLTSINHADIDRAAGCYAVDCNMTSKYLDDKYQLTLNYKTNGLSLHGSSITYLLPHHVKCLSNYNKMRVIEPSILSNTNEIMTGFLNNKFELTINKCNIKNFDPFSTLPKLFTYPYSTDLLEKIKNIAIRHSKRDIIKDINQESLYFSGRILTKYCWILFCCHFILHDEELTVSLLPRIEESMLIFIENKQHFPLNYDTTWGGIISSASYRYDFENSNYKNHNFHYCYFVIAAALLIKVEKERGTSIWLPRIKEWVETLIRDYSNPNELDIYFPVFRTFDWYRACSLEKGIYKCEDTICDEVHFEEINSSYALKLWGDITNNKRLEDIGSIQLGLIDCAYKTYPSYRRNNISDFTECFTRKQIRDLLRSKL